MSLDTRRPSPPCASIGDSPQRTDAFCVVHAPFPADPGQPNRFQIERSMGRSRIIVLRESVTQRAFHFSNFCQSFTVFRHFSERFLKSKRVAPPRTKQKSLDRLNEVNLVRDSLPTQDLIRDPNTLRISD